MKWLNGFKRGGPEELLRLGPDERPDAESEAAVLRRAVEATGPLGAHGNG